MSLRGYKPGELFRRTMLARVTNPNRNDTECQNTSFVRHFDVYMLSDRAMASGFRGFVGRDSPGDNRTLVNGGYLFPPCEQGLKHQEKFEHHRILVATRVLRGGISFPRGQ